MAIFQPWNRGLRKTRKNVFSRIAQIFQNKTVLSDDMLEEIEALLIESDAGVETSQSLIDALKSHQFSSDTGSGQPEDQVMRFLKRTIQEMLKEDDPGSIRETARPLVMLVVGVNGSGKTTTIGKLAWNMKDSGRTVLVAGADTFRAAAGEQLDVWAKRAGVDCIRQTTGADPASVAFDALEAAVARGVDVLLVDTAGRLHNKVNLMEELKKISRVLGKRLPGAPHEIVLVLDATTGQNGLRQAEQFARAVGVTQVALTKLDGTARGGIVLAIKNTLGIPVKWAGVGEGIGDLLPFDAEAFAEGMLGEGKDG
ncbi:signal recognition particle-docking protein FtsY [bacterium]|nr:signal recognition particle-docking protein FtsY [bacterium]